MDGWVKLYRKTLDNPIACKDSDYFAVWCYLLLNATHKEVEKIFAGEKITLKKGQLITGRKVIATTFNISDSKVGRILKTLENEQQIEQQTSNKNRLISIVNWECYQESEQQNEQQVNNNCTTSEHKQECKELKNIRIKELKNKRKEEKKTLTLSECTQQIQAQCFSEKISHVFIEWCRYKEERKEAYYETGFKSLCTQLKNKITEYGEESVCDVITESMANGWKGIAWVKLKQCSGKQEAKSKTYLDMYKEKYCEAESDNVTPKEEAIDTEGKEVFTW